MSMTTTTTKRSGIAAPKPLQVLQRPKRATAVVMSEDRRPSSELRPSVVDSFMTTRLSFVILAVIAFFALLIAIWSLRLSVTSQSSLDRTNQQLKDLKDLMTMQQQQQQQQMSKSSPQAQQQQQQQSSPVVQAMTTALAGSEDRLHETAATFQRRVEQMTSAAQAHAQKTPAHVAQIKEQLERTRREGDEILQATMTRSAMEKQRHQTILKELQENSERQRQAKLQQKQQLRTTGQPPQQLEQRQPQKQIHEVLADAYVGQKNDGEQKVFDMSTVPNLPEHLILDEDIAACLY